MPREGKRFSVLHQQPDEGWSRRKSLVTMLPPHVGPVPLVNEQLMHNDSRRGSTMSRTRSALAAARRKSVGIDNAQFVYLVDPQRSDPVAREQKERMLRAILKYDSPRPDFAVSHRSSDAGSSDGGGIDPTLATFHAFEDSGDDKPPLVASENESSSESERSFQPHIEVTATSPRKVSSVPALSIPTKRSPRACAEQRRKSLKSILTMPADVLSGLGTIEATLEALEDDRKLLGIEEQAEAVMSARAHKHRHKSPHMSQRSSPRSSPLLPALPPIVEPNFDAEVTDALRGGFNALDTLQEMMQTIEDTVNALRIDLVGMFDVTLDTYLKRQQRVVLSAINAAKGLLRDNVTPKAAEQSRLLQSAREELAAAQRSSLQSKNEVSKIQAAMRKHGIVPAKWNIVPPDPESCVLMCCDFPHASSLWVQDTPTVRSAMKLVIELERKLIKEMRSGYEASNDGTSFILVFPQARAALDWALAFQSQLKGLSWPQQLLEMPECQTDAKLLWRGLRARIAVHTGGTSTQFDPETQNTCYYGEALRIATTLMSYCPPGAIVASEEITQAAGNLRNLATHGGAHGVTCRGDVEGMSMALTRMVPHSLAGRLAGLEDNMSSLAHPCYPAFLMYTLRPSDLSCSTLSAVSGLSLSSHPAEGLNGVDEQVCVTNAFPVAMAEDEDTLKQLTLCLNLTTLPSNTLNVLEGAERACVPVVTVFVQVLDASKAFARHQPSLMATIRTLLRCVKKAGKGLNSGTDIACVGETVSLVFASRTEAITFIDRFLSMFYSTAWSPDTLKGWALAFPNAKDPSPDVVIGAHYCRLVNYMPTGNNAAADSFTALSLENTASFGNDYASLTVSTVEGAASKLPPSSMLLSGFAKNFDVACALASFALPGEVVVSGALADGCVGVQQTKSLSFMDIGVYAIHNPQYDGNLVVGISSSYQAKFGSYRSNASTLHSTVTAEGASWPCSSTVKALVAWVPVLQESCAANMRAMSQLLAERSINAMRRPPKPRDAVFVAVEAYVPSGMWSGSKKYLVLEALKCFQRSVRGLLTELDDGYEVFADPQCFFLAFSSPLKAFKFSIQIQDKLASTFWPPAFIEEFKGTVKRTTSSDGSLLWCGLRARVGMVTPPGAGRGDASAIAGGGVMVDTLSTVGTTMYFGKAVRWCIALCSAAGFGQTLIDDETSSAMQSSLAALDNPIVESCMGLVVPERQPPLQVFSARGQLLKARKVDCAKDVAFGESCLLSWFSAFTKDDSPIQYVVSANVEFGRVSRANSMMPQGVFDQPNETSVFERELLSTPDPFWKSATSDTTSPAVVPLPISTTVTPRLRRPSLSATPSRIPDDMVELSEYQELQEEFNRTHRMVKSLLDVEQLFVRTYFFKEQMRQFRSEEDFLKSIIQCFREAGIKFQSSNDHKHVDRAFMHFSNAVIHADTPLTHHAPATEHLSRTPSGAVGHSTKHASKDRVRPADVTASIAGLLCQFHTFFARGHRVQRRGSIIAPSDSGSTFGSPESHVRGRTRSLTSEPHMSTRHSYAIHASHSTTDGHLDLGAKAVMSSDSDDDDV